MNLKLAGHLCSIQMHMFFQSLKFSELCITISKGEELRNEVDAYQGRVTTDEKVRHMEQRTEILTAPERKI